MYVVENGDNLDRQAIIRLYPSYDGSYYNVETAGYRSRWREGEEVIAELSAPTQSEAVSESNDPHNQFKNNGSGRVIANGATSSAGKGSDIPQNKQEKALNYLHLSAPIAEASDNIGLDSAAKVIQDFDNPKFGIEKFSISAGRKKTSEKYDDIIDEIERRKVYLQNRTLESYPYGGNLLGFNEYWQEGLKDYAKRLKLILDEKASKDYTYNKAVSILAKKEDNREIRLEEYLPSDASGRLTDYERTIVQKAFCLFLQDSWRLCKQPDGYVCRRPEVRRRNTG